VIAPLSDVLFPDFLVFYAATPAFFAGKLALVYDIDAFTHYQNALLADRFPRPLHFRPFFYPPTWLLMLLPFGLLGVASAYSAFMSLTAAAATALVGRRDWWVARRCHVARRGMGRAGGPKHVLQHRIVLRRLSTARPHTCGRRNPVRPAELQTANLCALAPRAVRRKAVARVGLDDRHGFRLVLRQHRDVRNSTSGWLSSIPRVKRARRAWRTKCSGISTCI